MIGVALARLGGRIVVSPTETESAEILSLGDFCSSSSWVRRVRVRALF
jgi:hypothetical protein